MPNDRHDRPRTTSHDGTTRLRVQGHPLRHLELRAWHRLEVALECRPRHVPYLLRLMRRLDEASADLAAPETEAIGWSLEPKIDRKVVAALEEIVAVMREVERVLNGVGDLPEQAGGS